MSKVYVYLASHLLAAAIGFAGGIYLLPILSAGEGPTASELQQAASQAKYQGVFKRDLPGSDFLHWAQGTAWVGDKQIAFEGRVAPGPDYKVYLTSEFVDNGQDFLAIKEQTLRVGEVKTFDGFIVDLPPGVDLSRYNTVVIWCEAYSQFISAAKFR